MGLRSQRQGQGHLEESRMVMTLSHVGRGGGGEMETRRKARRPKVQREWVIKMVGLYKQEQPSPLEWGVEGGLCQPGGPLKKVGTRDVGKAWQQGLL